VSNIFATRFGHLPVGQLAPADADLRATVPDDSIIAELGIVLTHVGPGAARATMDITARHLNQAGVAQAGALTTLADAVAGWAAKTALDGGAEFTTLEIKANLLRSVRAGQTIEAIASPLHLGRSTMVLDVEVRPFDPDFSQQQPLICAFRCTQLVLASRRRDAAG